MSGGAYDYAYLKAFDMAHTLRSAPPPTPLRRAFADHLDKVATAMRAVEWVDSGDESPGDEDAAIRACVSLGDELAAATVAAITARDDLDRTLARLNPCPPNGG